MDTARLPGGEFEMSRLVMGGGHAAVETWRRVWGDGQKFRGPRFLNDDFFPEKFPFSRPKFLRTFFFSHRPSFSDFPFFTVIKCPIRPFIRKKNHYFKKEFLNKTIFLGLLCSSFRTHPTTLLL